MTYILNRRRIIEFNGVYTVFLEFPRFFNGLGGVCIQNLNKILRDPSLYHILWLYVEHRRYIVFYSVILRRINNDS